MDSIEQLLEWAATKGIKLNGIAPIRMPGRGVGLIATQELQPGQVILEIPITCLRNADTVPKTLIRRLPPKISIHGLLAADLALDLAKGGGASSDKDSAWNAVCPTIEDLSTAPLLWPGELQALLPHAARELLDKQKAKFARDWAGFSQHHPEQEAAGNPEDLEARYKHAWLLVNTRTFYYTNAKLKKRPKDDHMTLQPVADLFNHTDDDGDSTGACKVSFDYRGFTFKTSHAYNSGEEVHICYGRHGNDKLLVEYGFAMDGNRWDEVGLDGLILDRLDPEQKELLDEAGFLGNYVLDREDVCYRTQVALRLLCCSATRPGEWRRFVDGVDDGEASQGAVDKLLLEMLRWYLDTATQLVEQVGGMSTVGRQEQRDMLVCRWKQIREMLRLHVKRFEDRAQGS